jgi:CotH protein.
MARMIDYNVNTIPTASSPEGRYNVKRTDDETKFDVYVVSKGAVYKQGGGDNIGDFINVTSEFPPEMGYYTLQTAVGAIPVNRRTLGLWLTYAISQDKWESRQYTGTSLEESAWKTLDLWKETSGSGSVKSITLNGGEKKNPDSEGNIALDVEIPVVDETLDVESTNAIQNGAAAAKFNEVDANTLFSNDIEIDEENNEVTVKLNNKSGVPITEFTIPAGGGGGGGGEAASTKIVLNASLDKEIIKENDSVLLSYFYDHQYLAGEDAGMSTGQKARIEITMRRGSTTVYSQAIQDVSAGNYTLDISKYLTLGITDIYVRASTTDPETGKTQSKQAYKSVRVLGLSLSSSYNLANNIAGYQSSDTATIPFSITGTGNKVVTLYVDGVQKDTRSVTKSGTTNGSFAVAMSTLSSGRHTIQMVAELEASPELTIRSESIYFDILRRGSEDDIRFIGTKILFKDGRIFDSGQHLTPELEVVQYEGMSFEFVAYDSQRNPTPVDVYRDGNKTQTITAPRTTQIYTNRFQTVENLQMKFVCADVEYLFSINVLPSDVEIEEVSVGLTLKLLASGRSNSEENPAVWQYENIETVFYNFDWNSNGWTGDALRLTNGANIEVGFKPFATDPAATGGTYMIELECSNVSDRNAAIIDCMSGNMGFRMTTQQAILRSMGGVEVSTLFADSMNIQLAFVIRNKDNNRLMELYVNGIRCGAVQYGSDDSFLQSVPENIKINSEYSDVEIRNIRAYNRALSDDEILTNYIVDRPAGDEMILLFNENDVLTEDGSQSIDIDKLRLQGKSVMRVIGNVNLVNQTNDKKFEVPADIYFYSAYGKEYDFEIKGAGLRIQGTSSTSYPRKNYRIYFNRFSKYNTELFVNGVLVPDFKYSFKPGARPIDIFCMKTDFAESSSTHNTGTAVLMNDVWKKCGWLTPPQAAYSGSYDVRVSVDGFPCDMWYDNDATNANVYLGKFNFNNEKSASGIIYGFEGIEGFNDTVALGGTRNKCICLEFLNNSEPLCLFTTDDMVRFDDALEFRFPEDTTWDTAHADNKTAIQRLWTWIQATKNNPTKFVNEVTNYFDLNNLCAWYLFTEYFMAVDQRAKNMMLSTWDGLKWYFLPYDCDTILGVRNDGVLKYSYDIDHNSYDDSIQSWCYAGHDSELWKLVRAALTSKMTEVATVLRSNMPTTDVLDAFNVKQMANWSERVYNKDGEYKYITPLADGVVNSEGGVSYYNYLYSLQGSRFAHRTFIIKNRFALLDARYVVGTYRSDAFTAYFAYNFTANPKKVKITASEKFFFGYGFTSGLPTVSAVPAEAAGDIVELTMQGNLIVNDPQNFYGASRIGELDLREVSVALLQTLNLNNCVALKKLDASCEQTQSAINAILVSNCRGLEEINISGLRSPNFTSMDLSKNSRLERFIASGCALTGVSFAVGAPLTEAVLPASVQSLEMRSLKKLQMSGLTFEGAGNITRLVIADCDLLDWEELLSICYGVRYLRVTGIDRSGDASFLERYKTMGGIDENGSNTTTCRLVGNYQLTAYVEDEKLAEYRAQFPELNIRQSEYTVLEYDDSTSEPANVSNLDNNTGYKFGNAYEFSGHIKKILSLRHRVLGKKTAEGVVSICQLHDLNSARYADSNDTAIASVADLTGAEGSVWVYEPRYWFKGVNDLLNEKKYAVYSSNETVSSPEGKKVLSGDIIYIGGSAIRATAGFNTLNEAIASEPTYSYAIVNVEDYKKVRFQTVAGVLYGAVFLDNNDNIVGRVLTSSDLGTLHSMYCVSDIPEGAIKLGFSVVSADDKDFVWLTNSDKIEDMEPDWVLHEECLGGCYGAVLEDTIMRTRSGILYSRGVSIATARAAASRMGVGFRVFDYEAYRDVVNLAVAKYGTRNQSFGSAVGMSVASGVTNPCGMVDTIALVNPNTGSTLTADNTMGYESLLGNFTLRAEGLLINSVFRFTRRDGTTKTQRLPSSFTNQSYMWIKKIYHGREMEITPALIGGSSTTYYPDVCFQYDYAAMEAIYYGKGYQNNASYMGLFHFENNAIGDSSNTGTRALFFGTIKKITSVFEYKSLQKLD